MMLIVPFRSSKSRDLAHGALSALVAKYRSEECLAPRAVAEGRQDAQAGGFSDIATEDWDLLFHAVLTRLNSMLADANTLAAVGTADAQASRARTNIQECVEALDQLRTAMTHELARHRQPDRGLAAAQPAPARMRPDHIERPIVNRDTCPVRRWATSSTDDSADSSPMELFALGEHLHQCRDLPGRLFILRCHAERLHRFLLTHLVSSVLLVALMILLGALAL